MEPILLEEYKFGNAPKCVTNLLGYFARSSPDKNDILVGLLYVLMLESGFVHRDCTDIVEDCDFNRKRVLKLSRNLPDNWKSQTTYRMEFVLRSAPSFVCTLICAPVSDDLLVNCVVGDLASFSLLLDPQRYFASSNVQLNSLMFQNLDHLARNFKEQIAFPAKVVMVGESGGVCGCFQDLPQDVILNIMSYLKIDDVLNLAKTCAIFCQTALNCKLWIQLLDADYKQRRIPQNYTQLKLLYYNKYAIILNKLLSAGSVN